MITILKPREDFSIFDVICDYIKSTLPRQVVPINP